MGLIVQSWERNAWAIWASRFALFAVQLFIVTFFLHRTQVVSTPMGLALMATSAGLALLGGLTATVAYVQIWSNGGRGALRSAFAVFIAVVTLAWPAAYLPRALSLPVLNDVSTDLNTPPRISVTQKTPRPTGFLAATRDGPQGLAQQSGYPDLRPIIVTRTTAAAFDAARTIAKREGLDIVVEQSPRDASNAGYIQAIDETLLMGFRDDVVIRILPDGDAARIDIRSASRYGKHDFGRNAARIRRLSRQLRARLDFALPARLEDEADTKPARISKKKRKGKKRKARRKASIKRARTRPRSPRVRRKRRSRSRPKARGELARKALQRQ